MDVSLTIGESVVPCLSILVVGFVICRMVIGLSTQTSVLVSLLKVAIPAMYFLFWGSSPWLLLDDVTYFQRAAILFEAGFDPLTAYLNSVGYDQLIQSAQGSHTLYYLWNTISFYAFGVHYASPVFLNVAVTFLGGAFMARLVKELGFPEEYAKGAAVFFLLHWEVLSWSSFLNLKDTLQMTLVIGFFCFAVPIVLKKDLVRNFFMCLLFLTLIAPLRFYMTFVLVGVTALSYLVYTKRPVHIIVGFVFGVALVYLWSHFGFLRIDFVISEMEENIQFKSIIPGIVRMLVTPLPTRLEDEYSFLLFSSIFHLVFMPLFLASFARLASRKRGFLPIALFFLVVLALYGGVETIQGPRQRYQLCWIVAWCQYDALYRLLWPGRTGSTEIWRDLPNRTIA